MNVNLGIGCIVLFLLPFAAVGAVTAVLAVKGLSEGNTSQALFLSLFAIVFGGVGFGGIAAALVGRRKAQAPQSREAAFPDAPWLWRQDWASGLIADSGKQTLIGTWIFTLLWNLISTPGAWLGARTALREGNSIAWLALAFPLIGAGLLARAIHLTLRYRKFGVSRLELSTVPGIIGRSLIGVVRAPVRDPAIDSFEVSLTCIRRVTTGSGEHSSTTEHVLWQEQRAVAADSAGSTAMETCIPIGFRLPADAVACDRSNVRSQVFWRLQASASVPGVDYESRFEVPVFRTPESYQPLSPEEEQRTWAPLATGYRQPASSRIVVATYGDGAEIHFPAARNPGAATAVTVILLLLLGAIALQVHFHAPLLFPIVTALFAVLLTVAVLDLWLEVSRVTVRAGTLAWASGYLAPGRETTLRASEIADVTTAIGMQAGSTPYYDITVVRRNGKKVKVGNAIRNKPEAEWLVETIKRQLAPATSAVHE
jgi:uncharacterized membrane protein YedE/YeeE